MKNKKGDVKGIIIVVAILFLVLFIGLLLAFGGMIVGWVFDEAMPSLTSIGQVGSTNMSSIGESVLNPVNSVVQSFSWFAGVIYILALVGCLGLSFAFRFTGSKWLMGFFIVCMLLLVMASIFISNIYQDFYTGTDDVAVRLQEMTMLSWLLLYSPLIMCLIGFISGIIMFTGEGQDEQL